MNNRAIACNSKKRSSQPFLFLASSTGSVLVSQGENDRILTPQNYSSGSRFVEAFFIPAANSEEKKSLCVGEINEEVKMLKTVVEWAAAAWRSVVVESVWFCS